MMIKENQKHKKESSNDFEKKTHPHLANFGNFILDNFRNITSEKERMKIL